MARVKMQELVEALSLGTPVVGYAHGGVGEILQRLFPQGATPLGDADRLHARVRQLLASPPAVPPVREFSIQTMLDATLALYAQLGPVPHD